MIKKSTPYLGQYLTSLSIPEHARNLPLQTPQTEAQESSSRLHQPSPSSLQALANAARALQTYWSSSFTRDDRTLQPMFIRAPPCSVVVLGRGGMNWEEQRFLAVPPALLVSPSDPEPQQLINLLRLLDSLFPLCCPQLNFSCQTLFFKFHHFFSFQPSKLSQKF